MAERNIVGDFGSGAVFGRHHRFQCFTIPRMDYLLKTEPSVYSFANLERDKTTIWDGVTNPTAVKHLREMKPGERLVIYHTGDEKVLWERHRS